MDEYRIGRYPQSSILVVYSERSQIELDPDYQRVSGIWRRENRQLLIDSLINGFDVPKMYFHEFVPAKRAKGKYLRYAIIDGKQRLTSIWDFVDGKFALADDFGYLKDSSVNAAGLTYAELGKQYPDLKSRFDATPLDIVTIQTDDLDLIEDMFSRLNEAVPLNAPEKRNAFGGPLPSAIRDLAKHRFFVDKVPFSDRRYRHRDLVAKFLYVEFKNRIANTKKIDLDEFVRNFKKWRAAKQRVASPAAVSRLKKSVRGTLEYMCGVFTNGDSLLKQVGMISLYYYLFRDVSGGGVSAVERSMLIAFEKARIRNRQRAEAGATDVDQRLIEFDSHSQTPNDGYALRIREEILLGYLTRRHHVKVKQQVWDALRSAAGTD